MSQLDKWWTITGLSKSRFEREGLHKLYVPATALAPRSDPSQQWSLSLSQRTDKRPTTVTCNPSNVNSETFTWARVFAFLPSAQHVLSHQETVPGHCPNLFSPGFGSAVPRIFFAFKYSLFRAQGVPHHWQRYLIQKTLKKLLPSKTDRIAVSVFLLFWLSLTNTEWETNPNNNLMMSRAGLSN